MVLYHPHWGTIDVWVRLNRPLKERAGWPVGLRNYRPTLEAAGARHDTPGLRQSVLYPTCYVESLYFDRGAPEPVRGQRVEVELKLDATHRLAAAAAVQVRSHPDAEQQLGCPRRGSPAGRACHGSIPSAFYPGEGDDAMYLAIGADIATGTSCGVALDVIKSAGGRANFGADCYEDLCVDQNEIAHGFRCTVVSGDALWDIRCRNGHMEVRGYAAE